MYCDKILCLNKNYIFEIIISIKYQIIHNIEKSKILKKVLPIFTCCMFYLTQTIISISYRDYS